MPPIDQIHRLLRHWDQQVLTYGEFASRMHDEIVQMPVEERLAALKMLAEHANADVRKAAADIQAFLRDQELSGDFDYVRRHSPLRPGVRLELFRGYDDDAAYGKPDSLKGGTGYPATFVDFAVSRAGAIPAAIVKFDKVVEFGGQSGRYGVLRRHFRSCGVMWTGTAGVVDVYVVEAPPQDVASVGSDHYFTRVPPPVASYRIEGAG